MVASCWGQAPIPAGPECYTELRFRSDVHKVQMRRLKVYEQHTQDPPEVWADVMQFLDDFDLCRLGLPGHRTWAELSEAAKSLARRGSGDPLVGVFRARAQSRSNDGSVLYESEIWKCFDALSQTSYPARWKVEPLAQLDGGWPQRVPRGKPSWKELITQLAEAWIRDPEAREDERRAHWQWLIYSFNDFGIEQKTLFHDTCLEFTEADPWLWNLLSGTYHLDLGRHQRDHGVGVTAESRAWHYQNNLRIAGDRLLLAWQLDPKLPEPAAVSITVAMDGEQATASPRDWFDRAVAAQMDYEDAYFRYLTSLQPYQGGSFEKLYAFGKECLATKRFDTQVPRILVNAIYDITFDVEGHYTVFRNETIWAEVHEVFTGLLEEYDRQPNNNNPGALATQWMLYAIHSGHYDDACAALKLVEARGWKLSTQQHNYFRLRESSARSIVAGVGGPAAEAARKAVPYLLPMKRLAPKEREECLAALDEVVEKDSSEATRVYFGHWRQTLQWEKAYDAGDWVDLKFNPQMNGWIRRQGQWDYQPDGSMWAKRKPQQDCVQAFCNARFVGPYEVRVKVSLPHGCKRPVAPSVCVFVEFGAGFDDPSEVRQFWVTPLQHRAGVTDGYSGYVGRPTFVTMTEPNEIRLQIWPEMHTFEVNGMDVFFDQPTPDLPRERIALTTAFHIDLQAPVRFAELRVRKLNREPPPPFDFDARLAYYTQLLREDPDDRTAIAKRALALMGKKQPAAAAKDLDRALQLQPNGAELHLFRGQAAQQLDDYAQAIASYETAVKLDPQMFGAWRELAWTRSTCFDEKFRDGAKAVAAGKRACEIMKMRDYGSLIGLSAAYAEVGDHDQAIATAKKALPLAPPLRRPWTIEFIARRGIRMPERDTPTASR